MYDLDQVASLIKDQGNAFVDFKAANNQRMTTLEKELGELLKKSGRPMAGFGGGQDAEQKSEFMSYLRTGRESKAMSSNDTPTGGYLIPGQLDTELSKVLVEMSPMRQLARVVNVTSGDFSMFHSVGGTGSSWVGEKAARPATATPQFQKITPAVGEIYSNLPITQNLLDDNGFDLENWLLDEMSETFSAGEGDAFINGTGIVKPRGILNYDKIAEADGTRSDLKVEFIASGASGAFTTAASADKLINMVYALKPRYRQGAAWLLNSNTLAAIRRIKDGSGQNMIIESSLAAATPAKLLGYPIYEDENMPDIAANSYSIAFGNFQRGYTIIDRSTSVLRDPYSDKPNVQFYATRRVGGAIRDTRAIKLMKFATS